MKKGGTNNENKNSKYTDARACGNAGVSTG